MAKKLRLFLEHLEDRTTPAVYGNPWPDAAHLSLSFAPDGTMVGSQQSELFKTLNALYKSPTAWQDTILQAAQTWANQADINIGLVNDTGAPLGTGGPVEGNPLFGDIRITAVPLGTDVLAVTEPFDPAAGTWSGNVELNLNAFVTSATKPTPPPDLYTVALHELGHSLGLADNTDPSSIMYENYQGVTSGLGSTDIQAIRSLYGNPLPDSSDNSFAQATQLQFSTSQGQVQPAQFSGSISPNDIDYYSISSTNGSGSSMTVTVHTAGLSLLAPRLTVYTASKAVVATVVRSDPLGGDLSIQLTNVTPNTLYYIKVQGGTTNAFGVGAYQLEIDPAKAVTPDSASATNSAQSSNSLGAFTDLESKAYTADPRFDYYVANASLSPTNPVDIYLVRAPQFTSDSGTGTMTVMVWGTSNNFIQNISVYDSTLNKVRAHVLLNENGSYTVEVDGVHGKSDYFIAVKETTTTTPTTVGNYSLGIEFGLVADHLASLMHGTLSAANPGYLRTMVVSQTQLFHVVLSAGHIPNTSNASVELTITDQNGSVVLQLVVPAGSNRSATLFLTPGKYVFNIAGITQAGATPPASLTYRLRGNGLSGRIGPQPVDSSGNPISPAQTSDSDDDDGDDDDDSGYTWYSEDSPDPADSWQRGGSFSSMTDQSDPSSQLVSY